MPQNRMFRDVLTVVAAVGVISIAAQAGPPLLCHPYEIGDAKSLPWGGGSFDRNKNYDTSRLVPDTLALLTDQTPTLERLETLRRAAIYANSTSKEKCAELIKTLDARRGEAPAVGAADNAKILRNVDYWVAAGAIAQFEYRDGKPNNRRAAYDGLTQSLGDAPRTPDIEFVLAVMSWDLQIPEHHKHVAAACEQTAEESLLAVNILSRFGEGRKSLKEIQASHSKQAK